MLALLFLTYTLASSGLGKSEEAIIQYHAAGKLGSVSEYAGLGLAAYRCGKLDISREGIVGGDVILLDVA